MRADTATRRSLKRSMTSLDSRDPSRWFTAFPRRTNPRDARNTNRSPHRSTAFCKQKGYVFHFKKFLISRSRKENHVLPSITTPTPTPLLDHFQQASPVSPVGHPGKIEYPGGNPVLLLRNGSLRRRLRDWLQNIHVVVFHAVEQPVVAQRRHAEALGSGDGVVTNQHGRPK